MSLIGSLQNPDLYDHPVEKFEVIETHISWVVLTGSIVYKIKKPVNFGFLDFSTLEKRHLYCKEELRLNRRLAPELYLGVVSINGSEQQPEINGQGVAIEYAVKMKQFPQSTQLDRILAEQGIDNDIMDKLASTVAQFHLSINATTSDSEFGDYEHIAQPMLENFTHIRSSLSDPDVYLQLDKLEQWTKRQLNELSEDIIRRKKQGFVRECHGDMHLRNIALWNNEILIFDCIEFNKNFYWIDVISEIAFLVMDLEDRQYNARAQRFLNSYLEITGDYAGLRLLRFYKVYRALVRAKVDALRVGQEKTGTNEYQQTIDDFLQYLNLAASYTQPEQPCLLVNFGLSGSGKSVGTRTLLDNFPAIQLRSDVERKRLFKSDLLENASVGVGESIYTEEATRATYKHLHDIAECLLKAGYSVVIDAANLKRWQRQEFSELATSLGVPHFILAYSAPVETLQQRVIERAEKGDDVSDATLNVLQHQLETYEVLSDTEKVNCIAIDTTNKLDVGAILEKIQHHYN